MKETTFFQKSSQGFLQRNTWTRWLAQNGRIREKNSKTLYNYTVIFILETNLNKNIVPTKTACFLTLPAFPKNYF